MHVCYMQHFAEDLALGKYWLMRHLGSSEGHGKPVITEMAVFYTVANSKAVETSKLCEGEKLDGWGLRPIGEDMLPVRVAATSVLYACYAEGRPKGTRFSREDKRLDLLNLPLFKCCQLSHGNACARQAKTTCGLDATGALPVASPVAKG